MKIRIFKKGYRNQLVCERLNKSNEVADLGPNTPLHDIAHFVVERQFKLKEGFFGNIYNGYSVRELSEKRVIQTLSNESVVAEVAARALQAFRAGACSAETFRELIVEELSLYSIQFPYALHPKIASNMCVAYQHFMTLWNELKEGEALELNLEIETWNKTSD